MIPSAFNTTISPIRAIHVVPRVTSESSGPSHSVPNLCRALRSSNVDVQLMVLEPLPERPLAFVPTAHPTLPLPGAYRLGISPQLRRALRARARCTDILHNHSLWMMPNIYPGPIARQAGCKLVVSPRGTLDLAALKISRWRKAVVWRLGQRQAIMAADMLHATAASEYDAIRSQGLRQPVAILPNGVEIPSLRLRTDRHVDRSEMLFLSRIHPTKQVDRLLRVWSRLEPDFAAWSLRIVGPLSSSYARSMVELARELRLQRVTFAGELVGEDKLRALSSAEVFVLPTRNENFGLAIAESLAAGTPVITTRGAPWKELVTRQCGWWIADDEAALESAMREAMTASSVELREMGLRGRAWMESEFAWEAIGQRMATTYHWLLGRASRPDWVHD